jgi:hypothetical protein
LYGQWGHLETLAQPTSAAPKWKFLQDWKTEVAGLRHIDDVLGTAPQFSTLATLPVATLGQPYSMTIATGGGEGARTVEIIGKALGDGLSVSAVGDQAVISGTPTATGDSFVYLRVKDGDNDPAWRTFSVRTVGGPDVLVESSFEGTDPNLENLPWTAFYTKKPNLIYTGWNKGAGTYPSWPRVGTTRGLVYAHIDLGPDPQLNTLARAIAEQEYVTTSIQAPAGETLNLRNAEVRFTILRGDGYASPTQFAVMTSVGGFAVGDEVFTTPPIAETVDAEFAFRLPDTSAYGGLTGPVEIRLVSLFGIYAWKNVTLQAFKITSASTARPFERWRTAQFGASAGDELIAGPNADPDGDRSNNLLEYALNLSPTTPNTLSQRIANDIASNQYLRLTITKNSNAADVIYAVEVGSDLTTWSTADTAVETDTATLLIVRDTIPIGTNHRRFIRLRVTQQ